MEMVISGCKSSFWHARPKKVMQIQVKVGNL